MKARNKRHLPRLCIAPIALLVATAYANPNDALRLNAAYSLTKDDNLFRLSDRGTAPALVGRDSPSETIKTTTGSLVFERDYGLQHVKLDASAVNYDYQNFSYLSFTGLNYSGQLLWQLTPRFNGYVVSKQTESLGSFADFRNFGVRNERTTRYNAVNANYELDGAWSVRGGLSRIDLQSSAAFTEQRAFTNDSAEVGLVRKFRSNSEVSYRFRKGSGEYSRVASAATNFLPTYFDETEHEVRVLWNFSAKASLDSRIAYLKKTYNEFSFRNNGGVTASSNLRWSITSRANLAVELARDQTDFQTLYSSYSVTDKLTINPTWQIKEKLLLSFVHETGRRDFKGPVPGAVTRGPRDDKEKLTRLSLDWSPREFIGVSTWLARRTRESNYPGLTYDSNSVGMSAQVSF